MSDTKVPTVRLTEGIPEKMRDAAAEVFERPGAFAMIQEVSQFIDNHPYVDGVALHLNDNSQVEIINTGQRSDDGKLLFAIDFTPQPAKPAGRA